MGSNQELMILSLLNLYTSYVNLKKTSSEISNDIPIKMPRNGNRSVSTSRKEGKACGNNSDTNIKIVVQKQKVMSSCPNSSSGMVSRTEDSEIITSNKTDIDKNLVGSGEAICDSSCTTNTQSSQLYSTYVKGSTAKEKNKSPIKRRKRGEAKKCKELRQKKPRIRRWSVRPTNVDRVKTGYHKKIFSYVKKLDQKQFFEHTRMSKSLFDWLLSFSHSSLRKSRQSILPEERLVLTLNYLAFGTSLQSLAFKHKVGKSTARQIVIDTCNVLWTLLSPIYLSEPKTSQYIDIAEDFENKWLIPNCVGAIDRKRVLVSNPRCKDDNCLLVLAACDTKYKFSAVHVGNLKNYSSDGMFKLLLSNNAKISDNLPLPSKKPLYPSSPPFPHYFISDTSFPLRMNIMRPYTETNLDATKSIFNYKISRARTITENTFGILAARFRILLTTIEFVPEFSKIVVLTCIALHNYIMANDEDQLYCPPNFVDQEDECGIIEEGEWRNELKNNGDQPLHSLTSGDSSSTPEAENLRDTLASYFASEALSYEIQIV